VGERTSRTFTLSEACRTSKACRTLERMTSSEDESDASASDVMVAEVLAKEEIEDSETEEDESWFVVGSENSFELLGLDEDSNLTDAQVFSSFRSKSSTLSVDYSKFARLKKSFNSIRTESLRQGYLESLNQEEKEGWMGISDVFFNRNTYTASFWR